MFMLNKKIINIVNILVLAFILVINLNNLVYADNTNPIDNPSYFKPDTSSSGDNTKLKNKAGVILGVINVVGVVASVITLMTIGIKYMFGSIEEKAEHKSTAIMYLLGAGLVFGVTTIPNILYKIASNI